MFVAVDDFVSIAADDGVMDDDVDKEVDDDTDAADAFNISRARVARAANSLYAITQSD